MRSNHKHGVSFRIFSILLLFLIAGSFLALNNANTYAQNDDETAAVTDKAKELEVIVIDNKGYIEERKGPSKFEHVKHASEYKISCWDCHHDYKEVINKETDKAEKINIWSPWGESKKCSECHDPIKIKDDNAIKLQSAYHKNCKGCHEERKIFKNDYMAYRKCTGCHEQQ